MNKFQEFQHSVVSLFMASLVQAKRFILTLVLDSENIQKIIANMFTDACKSPT